MKRQGGFVRYLLIFLLVMLSDQVIADDSFWIPLASDVKQSALKSTVKKSPVLYFQLDESGFKQHLEALDAYKNNKNVASAGVSIKLPLLEGKLVALEITETFVMAAELAVKYPDIKHWQVKGVDDPRIYGVIGFTTLGFHAMVFMPEGDTLFVQRDNEDQHSSVSVSSLYAVVSKRSSVADNHFSCDVHSSSSPVVAIKDDLLSTNWSARQARGLVTYRLAMAATGEYTTKLGGKVNAMSEIAKTVARLNVLYSRDLALVFQLVANNDAIVFSNANTDPYSNGGSIRLLADENAWQRDASNRISGAGVIDRFIGHANYDIGHVMSVTRGGVAIVGGVCQVNPASGNHKAGASTGFANPTGENFHIDFVAHEIGHQLGATHTFNSSKGSCVERSAATAYEPGSGSSIMAYAGICSPNNVQTHSDAAFHIASIEQIDAYVRREQGSLCGIREVSTNNAPDILTITENLTVNANTVFTLTGSATDSDGDELSYAWDQFDSGEASSINVDRGNNALFRSKLPSALASRTFSSLATTNRDITFKFVVRDGKGGVSSRTTTVHVVNGSTAGNDKGGGSSITLLMLLGLLLFALLKMLYRRTT